MSHFPDPSQSPRAHEQRGQDHGEAEPEGSRVALQQCFGAGFVLVVGFGRDGGGEHRDHGEADGFADLRDGVEDAAG